MIDDASSSASDRYADIGFIIFHVSRMQQKENRLYRASAWLAAPPHGRFA